MGDPNTKKLSQVLKRWLSYDILRQTVMLRKHEMQQKLSPIFSKLAAKTMNIEQATAEIVNILNESDPTTIEYDLIPEYNNLMNLNYTGYDKYVDKKIVTALSNALIKRPGRVKTLKFINCHIYGKAAVALARMLPQSVIEHLDISNQPKIDNEDEDEHRGYMDRESLELIAKVLPQTSLLSLNLNYKDTGEPEGFLLLPRCYLKLN